MPEQTVESQLVQLLERFPGGVTRLLSRLESGRMNGATYLGPYRCIIGTLALGEDFPAEWSDLVLRNKKPTLEGYFTQVRPGDTPQSSRVVRRVYEETLSWADGRGLLK